MQEDETSTNTNKKKGEKPQAAEKEGEYEVNLEAMSKTPLKEKGKKGVANQKKKNVTPVSRCRDGNSRPGVPLVSKANDKVKITKL
jgi:hypothetical protein